MQGFVAARKLFFDGKVRRLAGEGLTAMADHELRLVLNDELHGRPGLPVKAPARITHLAFTLGENDPSPLAHLATLCLGLGLKQPGPAAHHHAVEFANGLLKFERHGEFYRISVTQEGRNLKQEAIASLPEGWVAELPGKRLVAIHTHILAKSSPAPSDASLKALFGHDEIACSAVNQGKATVWTDFRIGADGYTRMLIHDHGLTPMRMGRLTRRLHEIETYRMMALLGLPLARQLQRQIKPLEAALSATISNMLSAQGAAEDSKLLDGLTAIARDVEELSNQSSYRFAATRAYSALVAKRVQELGEERVLSYQRLGVFLDRRFSPAMATCNAVGARISDLATRSERASNLLRTRVDIMLETQNQHLLRSVDRNARQQLLLQQTVEGISVVAISYYAISIAAKLIEGAGNYLPALDVKLAELISIPVIIAAVGFGIWRVHRKLSGTD
jgi:uncharacterized membrane-anchored protein